MAWQPLITVRLGQGWVMQHPVAWFKGWVTGRILASIVPNKFPPILALWQIRTKKKQQHTHTELPGDAVWNPKLITKHLTKPDNYHEPWHNKSLFPERRDLHQGGSKCPPPIFNRTLKIKHNIFNTLGIQTCRCSCFVSPPLFAATAYTGAKWTCLHWARWSRYNQANQPTLHLLAFPHKWRRHPKYVRSGLHRTGRNVAPWRWPGAA